MDMVQNVLTMSDARTSKRLPIVDPDGRLWVWKPQFGYMIVPGLKNKSKDKQDQKQNARLGYRSRKEKAELRVLLWNATNGRCCLCGYFIKNLDHMTMDHVIPKHMGGRNRYNLVPAHRQCNHVKGSRAPTACELLWLEYVNIHLKGHV